MNKRVILLILDGWGNENLIKEMAISLWPISRFLNLLIRKYPNCELKTSGEMWGCRRQMGNSEVGHMNLGAGRVVYQQLVFNSIKQFAKKNNHKRNKVIA